MLQLTLKYTRCNSDHQTFFVRFFYSQVSMLSLSGGQTLKKMIWRVCQKVFAPHLAVQLNWCGRGHKRGVKNSRVREVIICK